MQHDKANFETNIAVLEHKFFILASSQTCKKPNSLLLMLRPCPQVRFMVKTGEAIPPVGASWNQEELGMSDHAR
jgi:hypothetical protein